MQIPFLDLRRQYREVETEVTATLAHMLARGVYILGDEVAAFEDEWARFCGAGGAAAVGNGTDALALALVASGAVRPRGQDEVIIPPLSAGYTALAVLNAGGVPVFADIDPETYTLDPVAVERAITPRTRAVVPVHLYGQLADIPAINEVASRQRLVVIEDAAQAHGALPGERRAGAHSRAAAFSFYPTKNLGAYGDGGAITSDDLDLIERVKTLRQGGHPAAMRLTLAGRNSRLDELQAAILRVKLKRLDEWNRRRLQLAGDYSRALSPVADRIRIPSAREPESHVFHLYVVEHTERESLRAHLAAHGIETLIHYPYLLHQQPLFKAGARQPLPVAERAATRIFSLPLYPQLRGEELRAVTTAILDFDF
ncbi:MAG: DegT/DnrJ/EryC1/StrS family aminotransferase [Acidobacteria bacterium]|nr:DegT/DnrJ/EryC1/StrS family aminotransferase [Acidobacteriota bacterium]